MDEIYILGTKIHDISLNQTLDKIQNHLKANEKGFIITPNPEICLKAYKDKFLRRIIKKSFICIPDGFGLKIGAFLFGKKLKNLTTGADLTKELLKIAEQNNYSVLFFEGQPKIGDLALEKIKNKHPNLQIKILEPGKVSKKGEVENKNLINEINQYSPDITFVNFGCPKQEYFINKNIDKLNTKLMVGVGGSFDFIAQRIKRAPKLFRKLGLEWLYRLFKEPSRWKRIINAVIIFPLVCIRFRFGQIFLYRNNVVGVIINNRKQLLITKHAKHGYWQFPQGGAKKAKTDNEFKKAVLYELEDELGTANFKPIAVIKHCFKYKWRQRDSQFSPYVGQKQSLVLLEFTGKDEDITIAPYEHSDWKWVSQNKILDIVPKWKKPLVQKALENFKKYL